MASIRCGSCKQRHPSAADVRACYENSTRRAPNGPRVVVQGQLGIEDSGGSEDPSEPIPNGTYTIVFSNDDYVTLRLKDDFRDDGPPGAQVVEYLRGPDNARDFQGFAFLEDGELKLWRRFRHSDARHRWEHAFTILLGSPGDQAEAREEYALRSGRCANCGRKLTVPASIHRGVGPICAEALA